MSLKDDMCCTADNQKGYYLIIVLGLCLNLTHSLVKANKSRGEDERAKSLIYTVCVCVH